MRRSQLAGCSPKNVVDVAYRVLGVIVAQFVRRDGALGADRPQQRARQRTRAGAGLEHPRTGEHVALVHDLRGVLGVDHLGAARHRQHVVDQQRTQHQERVAVGGLHHAALGQPDHDVVGDGAAVGVELRRRASSTIV